MATTHGNVLFFSLNDGYLDGFLRGFRLKILDQNDYSNLSQCESLDGIYSLLVIALTIIISLPLIFTYVFLDFKLQLSQTDYKDFLQNEPSPLSTTVIKDKWFFLFSFYLFSIEKLVNEFNYLRINSSQPLAQFLDYITYYFCFFFIHSIVMVI